MKQAETIAELTEALQRQLENAVELAAKLAAVTKQIDNGSQQQPPADDEPVHD